MVEAAGLQGVLRDHAGCDPLEPLVLDKDFNASLEVSRVRPRLGLPPGELVLQVALDLLRFGPTACPGFRLCCSPVADQRRCLRQSQRLENSSPAHLQGFPSVLPCRTKMVISGAVILRCQHRISSNSSRTISMSLKKNNREMVEAAGVEIQMGARFRRRFAPPPLRSGAANRTTSTHSKVGPIFTGTVGPSFVDRSSFLMSDFDYSRLISKEASDGLLAESPKL